MKICSAIINLFHLIPAAPQTLVKPLLEVVMKTERAMLIEVQSIPIGRIPTAIQKIVPSINKMVLDLSEIRPAFRTRVYI